MRPANSTLLVPRSAGTQKRSLRQPVFELPPPPRFQLSLGVCPSRASRLREARPSLTFGLAFSLRPVWVAPNRPPVDPRRTLNAAPIAHARRTERAPEAHASAPCDQPEPPTSGAFRWCPDRNSARLARTPPKPPRQSLVGPERAHGRKSSEQFRPTRFYRPVGPDSIIRLAPRVVPAGIPWLGPAAKPVALPAIPLHHLPWITPRYSETQESVAQVHRGRRQQRAVASFPCLDSISRSGLPSAGAPFAGVPAFPELLPALPESGPTGVGPRPEPSVPRGASRRQESIDPGYQTSILARVRPGLPSEPREPVTSALLGHSLKRRIRAALRNPEALDSALPKRRPYCRARAGRAPASGCARRGRAEPA